MGLPCLLLENGRFIIPVQIHDLFSWKNLWAPPSSIDVEIYDESCVTNDAPVEREKKWFSGFWKQEEALLQYHMSFVRLQLKLELCPTSKGNSNQRL